MTDTFKENEPPQHDNSKSKQIGEGDGADKLSCSMEQMKINISTQDFDKTESLIDNNNSNKCEKQSQAQQQTEVGNSVEVNVQASSNQTQNVNEAANSNASLFFPQHFSGASTTASAALSSLDPSLSHPSTPGSSVSQHQFVGRSSATGAQSPEPPIDPCNLIINYIPLNITEEQLKQLFSTYGNIVRCKLVTDKFTGCSLGYGFVKYEEASCAATAIAQLNGYSIANKRLKVSISKPPEREKKTNLYISGLPTDWTQAELEELVSQFGNITEVRVLYDATTRKGKGVGFARFESMTAAANAIEHLNGKTVDGGIMPLIVKYADTTIDKLKKASLQHQAAAAAAVALQHQHNTQAAPYGMNLHPAAAAAAAVSTQHAQALHSNPNSPLHFEQQLRNQQHSPFTGNFYGQSAVSPTSMNLGVYSSAGAATAAGVQTPNQQTSSLATSVAPPTPSSIASGQTTPMTLNQTLHHLSPAAAAAAAAMHTAAAAAAANHMQPINHPHHPATQNHAQMQPVHSTSEFIGYCLFVYHLPLEATEQTLYQLFSNYATVTSAKIMRDLATGRSKGFGFVNVLTEAQAHQAIAQLNGFQIGNKYLKVAFKK